MTDPAPEGARQALSTAAGTLLVVTVAFAAWLTFATEADAALVLGLAGAAFIALAAVPLLATRASGSLRPARWAYAIGALLALAALVAGFSLAFGGDGDDSDSDVPVRVDVHMVAPRPTALHSA